MAAPPPNAAPRERGAARPYPVLSLVVAAAGMIAMFYFMAAEASANLAAEAGHAVSGGSRSCPSGRVFVDCQTGRIDFAALSLLTAVPTLVFGIRAAVCWPRSRRPGAGPPSDVADRNR